jgi:hypothetical protein
MNREIWWSPLIRREDYDAFRRLAGADFPDSYDVWFNLASKEDLQRTRVGYRVEQRQVDPDEFARYCSAYKTRADGISLAQFVREKGSGKSY